MPSATRRVPSAVPKPTIACSSAFRSLRLTQNDFRIEPEITSEVCLRRLRIYEIPIAYYGRTYDEGKKITWRDGFGALGVLVAARVRGLRNAPDPAQPPKMGAARTTAPL